MLNSTLAVANQKYLNSDSGVPKAVLDQAQVNSLITGVFMVAGVVAVIFIIIGGYKYVVSQGNAQAVQQAKETIIYALVGLLMVMLSFTIVQFVAGNIF